MKGPVRVLLVGDRGTGKTSIAVSLLKEKFEPQVEPCTKEHVISGADSPDLVATTLVDSSLRVQTEDEIIEQLLMADVVCIVYAVDDPTSLGRVESHWLPLLREHASSNDSHKPVILAGNKSDLEATIDKQTVRNIMSRYLEIESCLECSARNLSGISEVIHYAKRAVLYPTRPIYLKQEHKLTDAAVTALKRVFCIWDKNNDGLLDDGELTDYNEKCFGKPLEPSQLQQIKDVVQESTENGIESGCLTKQGFLFLNRRIIEHGSLETVWIVLRTHGYDDDLSLKADYLNPALDVDPQCSTELSDEAIAFLTEQFKSYAMDHDKMTNDQLERMFSITPGNPFDTGSISELLNDNQDAEKLSEEDAFSLTLDKFLSLWSVLCHDNVEMFMELMAFLGFCLNESEESVTSAVHVTEKRSTERSSSRCGRSTIVCYAFGPVNSGKTSLLHKLARFGCFTQGGQNGLQKIAAGRFHLNGISKTLIMKEFAVQGTDEDVVQSPQCANECDIACFCYDVSDPSSFEYARQLHARLVKGPAAIFIGMKSDLQVVEQESDMQPSEYCQTLGLSPPTLLSSKFSFTTFEPFFANLIAASTNPQSVKRSTSTNTIPSRGWVGAGLVLVTLGVAVAGIYFLRNQRR